MRVTLQDYLTAGTRFTRCEKTMYVVNLLKIKEHPYKGDALYATCSR